MMSIKRGTIWHQKPKWWIIIKNKCPPILKNKPHIVAVTRLAAMYVADVLRLKNKSTNYLIIKQLVLFQYPKRDLNPHSREAKGF